MSTEIIVALLALIGTLAGSYFANNKNQAVMDEKIKDIKEDISVLSNRVDKHNNLIERMAIVEDRMNHIEKDIDKLKNPYFLLGVVAVIFASAGVDIATLSSWPLLAAALLSIVNSPFTLLCVIFALLAMFNDNSTSGLDGVDKLKEIFTIKKKGDK